LEVLGSAGLVGLWASHVDFCGSFMGSYIALFHVLLVSEQVPALDGFWSF
jgi:hypothetical protein